jgi:hypothetical protein
MDDTSKEHIAVLKQAAATIISTNSDDLETLTGLLSTDAPRPPIAAS